ncbi:hypothetical protein RhiirB3_448241 [Rhizophagus irregularis]|nr:hypothetical protein RhiirB3_448241 [Rhizophagus irregularis]
MLRKWSQNAIQPLIFNSMINNSSLKPIKSQLINGDIDWSFTKEWINHNPRYSTKKLPTSIPWGPNSTIEKILLDIIKNEISNNDYMLEANINGSRLFDRSFNGGLPSDHPFYLLIHHLVPCDLTEIFYNYIPKKKLRFNTFIKFMNILMETIDTNIWNRRNKHVKDWEKSLSITKIKKKFYHRRYRKNNDSFTSHNDTPQSNARSTYNS